MRLTLALACSLLLVSGGATPRPAQPSGITSTGHAARTEAPRSEPSVALSEPLAQTSRTKLGILAVRRISGTATWCAPTPRYCHGWGGKAMLAAVPSFRYGDEPYTVQVTGFHNGKANAVLVTVVSYCDCGRTVIDLSPHAFAQLAPLSVGRIRVVVDGVKAGRSIPLAPPTDTDGG